MTVAHLTRAIVASSFVVLAASSALAQNYPNKPVHMIVAYSAGGTGDVIARTMSEKLGSLLGQSIVVENRAGASGSIGARSVVTAEPDGYTLLVGQTGEVAINQHFLGNQGYDPDTDLLPVALAGVVPLALSVPAKAPYEKLDDYLKVLKSGKAGTFASAGTGTPGHFAGELLKARTKANITHVPYKGAGPALNDLIGDHVDMYFPGFPAVVSHMKAGTLKILAVSSAKRTDAASQIPTVAEATGIKEFDFTLWAGIFAPKGTPKEIVAQLNTAINQTLNDPVVRKKLVDGGVDVTPMSVTQFTEFVRTESGKYVKIIKETGIKPQ